MREEQKFELLEDLRKKARLGKAIVETALETSNTEEVEISETTVERRELEKFKSVLEKVQNVSTIEDARKLLDEETIPLELVILNEFWGEMQKFIYETINKQKENEDER